MSVQAYPSDRLEITIITCNHKDGAKLRGGGEIDTGLILRGCEPIIRQLIPSMPATTPAYIKKIKEVFAAEPLTLVIAVQNPSNPIKILGLGIYRTLQNTFNGTKFHVEGICTDAAYRSRGVGRAIMNEFKVIAKRLGCDSVWAQVAVDQGDAYRFFMKEKMTIKCFEFKGNAEPREFQPRASPTSSSSSSTISDAASPSSSTDPVSSPLSTTSGSAVAVSAPRPEFEVQHVTDEKGKLTSKGEVLLKAAEGVHRQLREHLKPGADYIKRMKDIFATGVRMVVAVQKNAGTKDAPVVLGVCVYRFYTDFVLGGVRNFVDDLVTDSNTRSCGVGHALLEAVKVVTKDQMKLDQINLDSGYFRKDAHRFYFREGMHITAYSLGVPIQRV